MGIFTPKPIHLRTNVPTHEVTRRLREAIPTGFWPTFFANFGSSIRVNITDTGCILRFQGGRNSHVARRLSLSFTPQPYGTALDGAFTFHPAILAQMIVFGVFFAFFCIAWFPSVISNLLHHGHFSFINLTPLCFPPFVYLMLRFNVSRSLLTDQQLLDFLAEKVNAHPADSFSAAPFHPAEPVPSDTLIRPRHESPQALSAVDLDHGSAP